MGWRCFEIAHYGVDPTLFLDADPEPFREHTGVRGPFVLQGKNRTRQKSSHALLGNARCRCSDSAYRWIQTLALYAELCRSIIGRRLTIIDHIPQNLLASAYAAASVHTLPSWMETCGLVSLEAALSGTPLVGSTFGHELEYLESDAWYADPGDAASIKAAVMAALQGGRQHPRAISMKRKVLERFNWERTVDATERLYKMVLERRK